MVPIRHIWGSVFKNTGDGSVVLQKKGLVSRGLILGLLLPDNGRKGRKITQHLDMNLCVWGCVLGWVGVCVGGCGVCVGVGVWVCVCVCVCCLACWFYVLVVLVKAMQIYIDSNISRT